MPAPVALLRAAAAASSVWLRHPLAPASVVVLLAGAVALQLLTRLPSMPGLALVGACAVPLWRWPWLRWATLFLLGACWSGWRADLALQQRLPRDLEGVDLDVRARLVDLPARRGDSTRINLHVEDARRDGVAVALHGRIRVSWYGATPLLRPCARWQLRVRLKRPRGASNPGGLDMERQAL